MLLLVVLLMHATVDDALFKTVTACEMSTLEAYATTAHRDLWALGCKVEQATAHTRALAVLCAVHAAALDSKEVRYNAIAYGISARIQRNHCGV